ncbi:MAG: ABC transporter permease [Chloroflexi bacterium]|nr:ABC transporter permease [Chloroflexota bacterium]
MAVAQTPPNVDADAAARVKTRRRLSLRFAVLVIPAIGFLVVFFILPLASTVVVSLWRTESYEIIRDWNLDNYRVVLTQWTYVQFLLRSLAMAGVVSAICVVYAWPVAYFIAAHGGKVKLVLLLLTAAPFLTGIVLRVTALQQILGPLGIVNMGWTRLGFEPIQALLYTDVSTAIGLVYLWIPFMVLAIYLSLVNFDFELIEVAKVNGASPLRSFFEVVLPLNWMGTIIGIVLVFIPTLAESVTAQFLGGVNGALFGNILAHQFGATGTWALGAAMGVVLFVASLLAIGLMVRTVDLKRSGFTGKEQV